MPSLLNTMTKPEEDDDEDWVFDTVKAPSMWVPKGTDWTTLDEEEENTDPAELWRKCISRSLHLLPSTRPTRPFDELPTERSPSVRRANTKRRSSGIKQPLGLDLSYGNSPSTVRQFRRVSDKVPADVKSPKQAFDENVSPKVMSTDSSSKEAQIGRRAYSKAVGLSCQEVLVDNWRR